MKCFNNSHVLELRSTAVLLASFIFASASEAALYTTTANTYTVQSWVHAVWQPGPAAPTSGNSYEILPNGAVQNPPGDSLIFPGDALTVDSGAKLLLQGTSPVTLTFPGTDGNAGLVLNGGRLQIQEVNSLTIDGQMAVATNSLVDLGWLSGDLVITAQLSGTGDLNLISWN